MDEKMWIIALAALAIFLFGVCVYDYLFYETGEEICQKNTKYVR